MMSSLFMTSNGVDPYLRQASFILQAYWNTMRYITNKDLHLVTSEFTPMPPEQFQSFHIQIEFPVIYVPALERESSLDFVTVTESSECRLKGSGYTVKNTPEALYLAQLVTAYNTNLLKVVTQEMQALQSLEDRPSPLSRELNKLADLKVGVTEFSKIVEKILESVVAGTAGVAIELPSLDELKLAKKKVCDIKKHLNFGELHTLFKKYEFKAYTEDIFCNIMGFKSEVATWILNLDISFKAHYRPLLILRKEFEETEEELREMGDLQDYNKSILITVLVKFGFTNLRAETICKSIPTDLIALQAPSFWAMRFMKQTLHYHPLLEFLPRYHYEPEKTNEWFTVNVPVERQIQQDFGESSTWPVQMINKTYSTCDQLVQDVIQAATDDNCDILYHGTSSVDAVSIVLSGVIVTNGSRAQDFSSSDGFALTKDFEIARKWAQAGRGGHYAVIVFRVGKELLCTEKEGGLNLYSDINKWQKIVNLCRSQYENLRLHKELLQGVNFILGPSCVNPARFNNVSGLYGDGQKCQFCIRGKKYAQKFGSVKNIVGVVFF